METAQRIVSLLPAATEACFALGLGERVVGVSHECDHPPAARRLPRVTRSRVDVGLSSARLDEEVRQLAGSGQSLYAVDHERVASLEPDLILTQEQCEVCAVSPRDLAATVAACDPTPRVLSLSSRTLEDVFQDMFRIAEATGAQQEAKLQLLRQWGILKQVRARVAGLPRPRVLVLDWLEPPMLAGNWVPELVEAAGGLYDAVAPGAPSRWTTWTEVSSRDPQALVLAPCGRTMDRTRGEWQAILADGSHAELAGVAAGRVVAVDGHGFFNRPGPRLVYSAAILAAAIHPEVPAPAGALERAMAPLAG